jgi:hypothetical protein
MSTAIAQGVATAYFVIVTLVLFVNNFSEILHIFSGAVMPMRRRTLTKAI